MLSPTEPADDPAEAGATHLLLQEMQLFGHRPFEDEPDPRPLPDARLAAGAVADIFDALVGCLDDTRIEPDLEELLWNVVNLFHRAGELLIVLAAVWTATQATAEALGFQAALGAPWFRIGDYPVYPPPAFFWWWFAFDAYAPPIFYRGAAIAASGGLLSVVVAISMSVWRARERRRAETYGSARWAQEREIR